MKRLYYMFDPETKAYSNQTLEADDSSPPENGTEGVPPFVPSVTQWPVFKDGAWRLEEKPPPDPAPPPIPLDPLSPPNSISEPNPPEEPVS